MTRSTALVLLATGVLAWVLQDGRSGPPPAPSPSIAQRVDQSWSRPASGAGGAVATKPVPEAKLALLGDLDPNQIYRPAQDLRAPDVFTAVEPPPPPPPPAPKVVPKPPPAPVVVAPPPPPAPPPMPFRFIGRYEDAGTRRVFLATTTEAFNAAEGDVLQGQWRVIAIAGDRVELLYLPLDARQTVVIP